VVAGAGRSAEQIVASWQHEPAGAHLLTELDAAARRVDAGAEPGEDDFIATALADLGVTTASGAGADRRDSAALSRPTAGLAASAASAISDWQVHVQELVRDENVTRRSIARVVSFDEQSLAVVLTIAVLAAEIRNDVADEDPDAAPQRLLASLFGAGLLRDIGARVRLDLRERVRALYRVEARRFFDVIDSAGVPDESAATELLMAGHALEAAR
jgi:hypothetical protein